MDRFARIAPAFILAALAAPAMAAEAPAQPQTPPPAKTDARSLIEAAKQATGGAAWDKLVTWHESGTLSAGGLAGKYESWEDLTRLDDSGSYTLGPSSGGNGWDGRQSWTTDSSGEVRIETSGASVAQAIQDAYRSGYGFFFPDRFPAKFEATGERQADGKSYPAVKVTPKDAEPFEIWFDPEIHRIAREVQLTGGQPHSFLFADYQTVDGVSVPKKIIDRVGGDPKFDVVSETGSLAFAGPEPAGRYAPPPPPKNSAEWPVGKTLVTVPFHLRNNHIYVEASIDGKRALPFVFDTGATDILDTNAAKTLGVKVEGSLPGGGFGDQIADFGLAKVQSVAIGGLTLPDQVFGTEATGGWISVEGTESAGLLGYEFVKRAVLTIDYARQKMTFTKQEAFQPPKGATAIPFTFNSHIPMLNGTLDGIPGQFELDTGSRGALTLMHPFAQANGLVEKYHATRTATVGYGVGGPSKALLGRAGTLAIGPVTLQEPVAEFVVDKGGAAEDARTAGNIGGDLLKRFTVTLDYAHRQLWLVPNALARQKEVFDRSGLWIARAKDGAIAVADVTADSAAAKAGLAEGDEITKVDGKPAKDVALYTLRDAFKGPVGTKFTLGVKGKTGEKTLTLVLADQV